ncbi:hypothetical protein RFM98_26035, partial [Mesorhizobium sp. VK9D]|uniref:hypothetical protein n=1 Tax=Mesorhizobium australafricanum TaxID=3072311 RepID=UPI002A23A550
PRMRPIGRRAFLTVAPDTKLLSSINTQKQNPAEIDGVCQQSDPGLGRGFSLAAASLVGLHRDFDRSALFALAGGMPWRLAEPDRCAVFLLL